MDKIYQLKTAPQCNPENVIQGEKYRITLLTEQLIRLEYSEDGVFEDRATQSVLNRDFAPVAYKIIETEDELQIRTNSLQLNYNKQEFKSYGLSIQVMGNISNYHSIWHYGEEIHDLGGTARTLDHVDGACELEHGLMSQFGFSVLDDSKSLIITEDGWVEPRKKNIQDVYFFGYGHDYLKCLNDFYHLCGKTPMLPRYAMGNWWARYYEYTEDSYMELMNRFEKEEVPFSVAVVDMDWHLVDVDPKYGSGWTGYTWNKDFFPDPKRFMEWLHKRGMKITLNVHPADGVRAYEEMYEQMAEALHVDASKEEPINFDVSSPEFMKAYFDVLHHPNEEAGVDFWWLDWQQGSNSKIEGLDPLWMLNHYHFLDSGRDGKRPITFSRYAGPGSHRYPVGFSGDTHMTWESLDFQPYFTNTASNIGYGWWSHDIGGHMKGYKNDEMAARWLQYGVFSPINRLHSTKDEFNGKEPWRYNQQVHQMMNRFLRLRHEMIPYLYTMNYLAYKENKPLVQPMYYKYPEAPESYEVKNQYYFGTEMIVAPITESCIKDLNVAKVKVWLPEGHYTDIFTGMQYIGGRYITMYRSLETIPVLVKDGTIIPTTKEIFGTDALENPKSLVLDIYPGADAGFTMYEDDNETKEYEQNQCVTTEFKWNQETSTVVILPAAGDTNLLPAKRSYKVRVHNCTGSEVSVACGQEKMDAAVEYDLSNNVLEISVDNCDVKKEICISFAKPVQRTDNEMEKRLFDFLNQAEIAFAVKNEIYSLVCKNKNRLSVLSQLQAMEIDEELLGCLTEFVTAE